MCTVALDACHALYGASMYGYRSIVTCKLMIIV